MCASASERAMASHHRSAQVSERYCPTPPHPTTVLWAGERSASTNTLRSRLLQPVLLDRGSPVYLDGVRPSLASWLIASPTGGIWWNHVEPAWPVSFNIFNVLQPCQIIPGQDNHGDGYKEVRNQDWCRSAPPGKLPVPERGWT